MGIQSKMIKKSSHIKTVGSKPVTAAEHGIFLPHDLLLAVKAGENRIISHIDIRLHTCERQSRSVEQQETAVSTSFKAEPHGRV